jgi:hypothetical protein
LGARQKRVRLFGITKAGLLAMSIAVMALWTCLAMERSALRHANRDVLISLRRLESLRQRNVPVANPSRPVRTHVSFAG